MLGARDDNDGVTPRVTAGAAAIGAMRPDRAQYGHCGVLVLPRDTVVLTGRSHFMVLTECDARDLLRALCEVFGEQAERDAACAR